MTRRGTTKGLAVVLAVALTAALVLVCRSWWDRAHRTYFVGTFDNSNGVFAGDDVRIMGVTVGKIDTIEPQPQQAKISFWIEDKYRVPADVKAVILSPSLVTARAIQLTPPYTGGPTLADHAVIPRSRTAVPVEWDDFRNQLQKLADTLQPTKPGGVSTLGALVDTAAENLRGQGASIRDTVIKLSQAFSVLGDHSTDIFSAVKHLAVLVAALRSSADLMQQLNRNLATVSGLLANDPDEVAHAVSDVDSALADVHGFITENKGVIGEASQQLSELSKTLVESLDDIKQTLHITPNTFSNFSNTYRPATGESQGVLAMNNFSNPISFLCGAIQAASRLRAEQAAKLCVQYLAPILKNRQYNFPPVGGALEPFFFPLAGAMARPNEITFSEDSLRPDRIPPAAPTPAAPPPDASSTGPTQGPAAEPNPPPPEGRVSLDPSTGLAGMMAPAGGGS
ncbi:mammalian cell entry protein [Mycobacterium paraense]|uniref:Mammalian cell entry protein n=1 Tax=Mycobacterium paraense TaxID=767916 RepID=A0ABX3VR51_9MYCO|nr:MCE family protein [Mycobacterium paraense]ORW32754.1 mammalian cell entry protein [Mycobacterium paraense]ORW44980.1 mammalian cell entry protein [Mycobacterium paraense]